MRADWFIPIAAYVAYWAIVVAVGNILDWSNGVLGSLAMLGLVIVCALRFRLHDYSQDK